MSNSLIQSFQKVDKLLRGASRVLVASHENPDPDAIGSVLAVHRVLKRQGLDSFPYLPNPPSQNVSFLPGFSEIRTKINSFRPDVLVGLDYGDFKRLKLLNVFSEERIITIDHHQRGSHRGKIQIIEPKLSSTAEILYHWFKATDKKIDKKVAHCLLAGIIADSGGFQHVGTSSKTFNAVADLLSKGISLPKIMHQILDFDGSLSFFKVWGKILTRVKTDRKSGLAYSWLSFRELSAMREQCPDLQGVTNIISAASPQSLGLFLLEYEPGRVRGSLRAEACQGKRVHLIAEALGGGGHPYAAGFEQKGDIKDVLKKVIDLID